MRHLLRRYYRLYPEKKKYEVWKDGRKQKDGNGRTLYIRNGRRLPKILWDKM